MYPNIFIAHMAVPNWFLMVGVGAVVTVALALYCVPKDFALRWPDRAFLSMVLVGAGLLGGRILFNILHGGKIKGGFAYFGALIMSIIALWLYSSIRKIKFLGLADYAAPFLLLSQAFIRIGCFMAGCCYGKPTHSSYGVIFETVDKTLRHPTQAYECILLVVIYIVGRAIYNKENKRPGDVFFITLFLYGAGRFFIEFLRVDSPVIFYNLTLAHFSCLTLASIALIARLLINRAGKSIG